MHQKVTVSLWLCMAQITTYQLTSKIATNIIQISPLLKKKQLLMPSCHLSLCIFTCFGIQISELWKIFGDQYSTLLKPVYTSNYFISTPIFSFLFLPIREPILLFVSQLCYSSHNHMYMGTGFNYYRPQLLSTFLRQPFLNIFRNLS